MWKTHQKPIKTDIFRDFGRHFYFQHFFPQPFPCGKPYRNPIFLSFSTERNKLRQTRFHKPTFLAGQGVFKIFPHLNFDCPPAFPPTFPQVRKTMWKTYFLGVECFSFSWGKGYLGKNLPHTPIPKSFYQKKNLARFYWECVAILYGVFCRECFFSLPPRGRTEGACVQKQIRCLFGWCNTIVAQAPSTAIVVPLPLGGRLRDLAFSCTLGGCCGRPMVAPTIFVCTFGGCAAICVCLHQFKPPIPRGHLERRSD